MEHRFRITLAADLGLIHQFRDFVHGAFQRVGLEPRLGKDIEAAVAEACRIIAQYGYAGLEPGSIEVTLTLEKWRARVEICDFGHPFVPVDKLLEEDDPATVAIELPPVFQRMARIEYHTGTDGNHLVLVQKLAQESDEEAHE